MPDACQSEQYSREMNSSARTPAGFKVHTLTSFSWHGCKWLRKKLSKEAHLGR